MSSCNGDERVGIVFPYSINSILDEDDEDDTLILLRFVFGLRFPCDKSVNENSIGTKNNNNAEHRAGQLKQQRHQQLVLTICLLQNTLKTRAQRTVCSFDWGPSRWYFFSSGVCK